MFGRVAEMIILWNLGDIGIVDDDSNGTKAYYVLK